MAIFKTAVVECSHQDGECKDCTWLRQCSVEKIHRCSCPEVPTLNIQCGTGLTSSGVVSHDCPIHGAELELP